MAFRYLLFILLGACTARAEVFGLNTIDSSYVIKKDSVEEVKNLPPVMSQDSLGICYSYAAATLLTAENCRSLKTDCTTLPASQIFSPLGLSPLGVVGGDQAAGIKGNSELGGSAPRIMESMIFQGGSSPSEECLSLDKVLSKIGGAGEYSAIQDAIWEKLRKEYKDYQEVDKGCAQCVANIFASANDELDKNFEAKQSNDDLLRAFNSASFAGFLDELFQPRACRRAKGQVALERRDKKVSVYPEKKEKGTYDGAINNIKNVLKSGRPLSLGGFCSEKEMAQTYEKCNEKHAVVVAGYRKVCNDKNECRDAIKVINSWGETWQKDNDQGWVDAKEVLERTYYHEASLAWFSEK